MAPSSRPSMYLSVIKIRNILISLIGRALHTLEINITNGQIVSQKGHFSFFCLFVRDQMLALNGQQQVWREHCLFTPRLFVSFVTGFSIFGNWLVTVYIPHH